jgi:hypothetical protein
MRLIHLRMSLAKSAAVREVSRAIFGALMSDISAAIAWRKKTSSCGSLFLIVWIIGLTCAEAANLNG